MTATLRVRVCSPFPRYTEKPCDNGQESSRVDEELRLLHNHRRARCLDIQCNAHCRLCTVELRCTKRHCSSQFREYVATNYRPKRQVFGRVSVYSRYSILLSSVQTGPMHADSEWLCIGTKNQVIAPSPLREFVAKQHWTGLVISGRCNTLCTP